MIIMCIMPPLSIFVAHQKENGNGSVECHRSLDWKTNRNHTIASAFLFCLMGVLYANPVTRDMNSNRMFNISLIDRHVNLMQKVNEKSNLNHSLLSIISCIFCAYPVYIYAYLCPKKV